MKKVFKILLYIVAAVAAIVVCFVGFIQFRGIPNYTPTKVDLKIEYTPQRAEEGKRLASMLCKKCHMNQDGSSVSGRHMLDCPAAFGEAFSANITQDKEHGIGKWTDGELAAYIRTGVKPSGQYVPPYMPKFPHLSDEDLACIISWLHSDDPAVKPSSAVSIPCEPSWFCKFLCNVAIKALPYPTAPIAQADTNDLVALGKYCVQSRYQCYACHSADFATNKELQPELSKGYCGGGNKMPDYSQKIIPTQNITMDEETGIGNWSFEDFSKALKSGIMPNNQPALRYPMDPYINLTDKEVAAIYAYLKTIPKIKNKVDRGV